MSWLTGWSKRLELTIDSSKVDEDLTNFPLLITLSSGVGIDATDVRSIFSELGDNSKKLAVTTTASGNQCYVEIEKWDASNQEAYLWTKVPSISSTQDTKIYLYYDSTQVDNTTYVGDTGDAAAQSVWDSDFELVCHTAQDPSGGADCILDSTSNANHGTPGGSMTTADLVDGEPGGGIQFDGSDDFIDLGNSNLLNPQTTVTYAVAVKFDALGSVSIVARDDNSLGRAYNIALYSGVRELQINGAATIRGGSSVTLNTSDSFLMHVIGSSAVGWEFYINGSLDGSASWSAPNSTTGSTTIGKRTYADYPDFLAGIVSEVRISAVTRSAAWIKADYHSCFDTLVYYKSEESEWLGTWAKRMKMRIDSSKVDNNLTNFPVLVTLSSGTGINNFDATPVFNEIGSDGNRKKIAITSASGTQQCYVEIEKWDTANQEAYLWTKLPTVYSGADTYLYLYYDSTQSDNTTYVGDTGDIPAQNVWDNNFVGVWHMAQDPNGDVADAIKDSTGNGYDLTPDGSMTSSDLVAGKIGDGLDLDSSNDQLYRSTFGDIGTNGITLSIIMGLTGYTQYCRPFSIQYDTGVHPGAAIVDGGSGEITMLWVDTDGSHDNSDSIMANTTFSTDGSFQHITGAWDGTGDDGRIYINGVDDSDTNSGSWASWNMATGISIGEYNSDPAQGIYDEARISNIERTADWIKADYYSCFNNLLSFEPEVYKYGTWLGDWAYRRTLKLDSSLINEDLTDFPVLIHLSNESGRSASDVSSVFEELATISGVNRKKIAITTDDYVSQCYVEVEKFDETGSLELHYKMNDDADSSDVTDSTGNGHTGTLVAGSNNYTSEVTATGKINQGFDFSGAGEYVDIPNDIGLFDGNSPFSVSLWFNPDSIGSVERLWTLRGEAQLMLFFSGGSDPETIDVWANGNDKIVSNATFGTGSWHHVVLVYDPDRGFALYANGSLDTDFEGTTAINSSSYDNRIASKYNSADYFDGRMDDFRIYSKALSDKGIYDLYNNGYGTESETVDGEAWLWTKVPTVYSGIDTTLYLYYDSSQPDNTTYVGDTGDAPAQNVWDSGFVGVWHMAQDPTGGADCILDSTSNVNNGTPSGFVSGDLFGSDLNFNGSSKIDTDGDTSFNAMTDATFEFSISFNSVSGYQIIGELYYSGTDRYIVLTDNDSIRIYNDINDVGSGNSSSACFSTGTNHHIAVTVTPGTHKAYVDNTVELDLSHAQGVGDLDSGWSPNFGYSRRDNDQFLDALVKEARIHNTVRSMSWIKADYYSCLDNLVLFGLETQQTDTVGWLSGWGKRIKFTIDNDKVDEDLVHFPVLLTLSSGVGINDRDLTCVFDEIGSNSKKLAATKEDGVSQLYIEVESWDSVNEEAYLWTSASGWVIPAISSTDIYLYYDNTKDDNTTYVGDSGDSSAQNVWDSDFVGVWHMGQDPSGGADCILDSTSYGHHGTPAGSMTAGDLVDGLIGKALNFDGSDDDIGVSDTNDLDLSTAITIDALGNPSSISGFRGFLAKGYGSLTENYYFRNDNGVLEAYFTNTAGSANQLFTSTASYSAGSYQLASFKHTWGDGTSTAVYHNGTKYGGSWSGGSDEYPLNNSQSVALGGRGDEQNFAGEICELRLSKVQRSDAWSKSDYYSCFDSFLTAGTEEGEVIITTYYFTGYVYEENNSNPVSRTVRIYNRDTGALIGSTTSSGNGYYYIETTYSGSHYLVALDDNAGTQYNLAVLDRMDPAVTTISG